jgi:hypothetical protein
MNIGDRVRLVHFKQEGIITGFLPNSLVEVEIEDGFKMPVLRSELVTIAKEEKIVFTEKKKAEERAAVPAVTAESGVYLAFLPINDKQLSLYVLNNTDIEVLFTLGEAKDGHYAGLAAGHLAKRTMQKVHEANLDRFDKWSPLVVQVLFFRAGFSSPKEPLTRKLTFSASTFFKSKRPAPVLDREAYLFQIDQKIASIDPEKLKESLTERAAPAPEVPKTVAQPPRTKHLEVDLHIEQLTDRAGSLNAGQMLEIQLAEFEKRLDAAILANADEVTFIHGVGNGTLRHEIQKRLGKHPHVQFFQDAKKERFGYGATSATLK